MLKVDLRAAAVSYALAELARENVKPDYNPYEPCFITEQQLVDDVRIYGGDHEEVQRLFVISDVKG